MCPTSFIGPPASPPAFSVLAAVLSCVYTPRAGLSVPLLAFTPRSLISLSLWSLRASVSLWCLHLSLPNKSSLPWPPPPPLCEPSAAPWQHSQCTCASGASLWSSWHLSFPFCVLPVLPPSPDHKMWWWPLGRMNHLTPTLTVVSQKMPGSPAWLLPWGHTSRWCRRLGVTLALPQLIPDSLNGGTPVFAVSFWHGSAPHGTFLLLFHPSLEARFLAESGEQ